ncbi:MAG TPA: type 4a pilus biogenesis protein PilO [Gaiellaceae bacterium]
MTARFASLSDGKKVASIAGALLLVGIIGYLALIAPKRSTAASLKQQTAAVQKQIDANRSTGFMQALPAVRSAGVFSLAKAMPKQLETPNVILQLSELAKDSGITFDQITPNLAAASAVPGAVVTPDTTAPFAIEPIQVQFSGSFYDLVTFLQRVRNLVRVDHGRLQTYGRLFDVSDIAFCEVPASSCTSSSTSSSSSSAVSTTFPHVQASLTINAFVPQQPQAATVPGSTDTTGATGTTTPTTTTTDTTTTPATSAAPSTSGGTS